MDPLQPGSEKRLTVRVSAEIRRGRVRRRIVGFMVEFGNGVGGDAGF